MIEVWDLWFPDAGATGVSFARSRVDAEAAGDRLLVHAAPSRLDVTVRSEDGEMLARGEKLERHEGPHVVPRAQGPGDHAGGWIADRSRSRAACNPSWR